MRHLLPRLALAIAVFAPVDVRAQSWLAIPLNPAGFQESQVFALSPTQQFGNGYTSSTGFGIVWGGSAATWSIFPDDGAVRGISGGQQVGGTRGAHAALWFGTSASIVD